MSRAGEWLFTVARDGASINFFAMSAAISIVSRIVRPCATKPCISSLAASYTPSGRLSICSWITCSMVFTPDSCRLSWRAANTGPPGRWLSDDSRDRANEVIPRRISTFRPRTKIGCAGEAVATEGKEAIVLPRLTPAGWSPRQESNLYPTLRRRVHYPLCYEEWGAYCSRCL